LLTKRRKKMTFRTCYPILKVLAMEHKFQELT
jgi:hypothetical protein